MEVMILTETTLTDAEVVKWTKDAMRDYCDFHEAVVTITESHETVFANLECVAEA